ncbi:MAG: M56 family metallopeptidase [Ruminococcus sp.]|nr:M56 family metallopeptidase [Ruminococcus sp.]
MTDTLVASSLLIIAVLILRAALKGHIGSRMRYAMWLTVVLRLMLPFSMPESPISVMNLFTNSGNVSDTHISELFQEPVFHETADTGYIAQGNVDLSEDIGYISENYTDNSPTVNIGAAVTPLTSGNSSDTPDNNADISPTQTSPESPPLMAENTENAAVPDISDTPVTAEVARSIFPLSPEKTALIIWAFGAVIGLLWFTGVNISFSRQLHKSRIEIPCPSPLPVYSVDFLKSPCLFGNAVYINPGCKSSLKYIIAHEYSHYRHMDHVWSAVRQLLLCVYWFDPLVWAAAYISKTDCECACDEAALEILGESERAEYGRTLLETIPRKGGIADTAGIAATSMTARGKALQKRLRLIAAKPLDKRSAKAVAAKTAAILVMTVTCGCAFTAAQDSQTPQDNGIALTDGTPAAAHDERQYLINMAYYAYDSYLLDTDNYKEFYDNGAAAVYAEELTVNPDFDGEFSAFFNLWIEYPDNRKENLRLNYSPDDNVFEPGEVFETSYIPDYLDIVPQGHFYSSVTRSWEDFLDRNYPCELYNSELNGEPVKTVWIMRLTVDSNALYARSGFIMRSENYYQRTIYTYSPEAVNGEHWQPREEPVKDYPDPDLDIDLCERVLTPEEYSRRGESDKWEKLTETAEEEYDRYIRTLSNYEYLYRYALSDVYADKLSIYADEDGQFTASFNLWADNGQNYETVRVSFYNELKQFYPNEPQETVYFDGSLYTKLPRKGMAKVFGDSWEDYVKHNYPCDLYNEGAKEVWVSPVSYEEGRDWADAEFVAVYDDHFVVYGYTTVLTNDRLSYINSSGFNSFEYNWETHTGSVFTVDKDNTMYEEYMNKDFAAEGYTLAKTPEEYFSRQIYHPGDVIYSFSKQVPLSDGSGVVPRTVQLVMTAEDYTDGLPNLNYTLQGEFILRLLDSNGNITGECPIDTAQVNQNGFTSITASASYMSLYFKFSKADDRLLVFSIPNRYSESGRNYYTAFYGITDSGELFRYHIDKGEFDYPLYMGGDELFTGELYSNSQLYSPANGLTNKGGQYMVSVDRVNQGSLALITFNETTHTLENAFSLEGNTYESESLPLQGAMNERYNYLFFRHLSGDPADIQETYTYSTPDSKDVLFSGENLDSYFNMPMGGITEKDLFYALSAEAEAAHPGVEDMIPFTEYGSGETAVHFHSDLNGESREYAADFAIAQLREDGEGSYYVYFLSCGCDYCSVCRYTLTQTDGIWHFSDFERIL